MKATELLTNELREAIKRYNTATKFNTFLYNNPYCNKEFADINNGTGRIKV